MGREPKPLQELLGDIVVYDGDDQEWTLGEIDADAANKVCAVLVEYLERRLQPAVKPVFGDTSAIAVAAQNKIVSGIIDDVKEWR